MAKVAGGIAWMLVGCFWVLCLMAARPEEEIKPIGQTEGMMLKIRNSKVKIFGAVTCCLLLGISYIGLSFYSIPQKANAAEEFTEWRNLTNITYMQEMTIDICNNSDIGDRKALIDNRGGGYDNQGRQNSYVVQKLEDGNCWMVQNLRLLGGTTITTENSDLNTGSFVASGSNTNVTSGTTYTLPVSSKSGFSNNAAHNMYNGDSSDSDPSPYNHKYGAYYTWCTATAGCKTKDGANPTTSTQEAGSSICPKGWRLPTSNKTSTTATGYNYSFNKLVMNGSSQITATDAWKTNQTDTTLGSSFGITTATNGAVFSAGFFPAAGYVDDGSLSGVGSYGRYWSSTALDSRSAYYLNFSSSDVYPSNNVYGRYRYYGNSVRCVANPEIKSSDLTDTTFGNIDANVNVQVGPTLTIDAAEGMSGEVDYTKILEGNISATISSNLNYKLMLSAKEPSLKNTSSSSEAAIPPVLSMETALEKGTSGWGIWTGNGITAETRTYEPITTTPKTYHSTTSPAADGIGTVHTFGVGIAVSPSIPNGTYSTVVTVTAANA